MDEYENEDRSEAYVVPTYWGDEQTTWYHFLHGNVPGHQIDFMYRPEVPQGVLTRQHFSHLSRLMKYIEPQTNSEYAFAIGNLSRDDTQYEPGRGGLGLIFGFRIRGVTDHAGRQDPPFAHGIAAVTRTMDYSSVLSSSLSFFQHLFGKGEYDNPASQLYREYVRHALERSPMLSYVLKTYTAGFQDLPQPDPSSLSLRWLTNEAPQPKRIVIVHPNSAKFGTIAECAAKIAAVLYQSDIRWTCITTGRESDLPGGVTIRLVARRDAGAYSSGGPVMSIDEVPDDEAELAEKLFNAQRVGVPEAKPVRGGWREQYGGQSALGSPSSPSLTPRSEPSPTPGGVGSNYDAAGITEPISSQRGLWESRAGNGATNSGLAEPPKQWSQSAKLSPDELRAAIGLPPLPKAAVTAEATAPLKEPPAKNIAPGATPPPQAAQAPPPPPQAPPQQPPHHAIEAPAARAAPAMTNELSSQNGESHARLAGAPKTPAIGPARAPAPPPAAPKIPPASPVSTVADKNPGASPSDVPSPAGNLGDGYMPLQSGVRPGEVDETGARRGGSKKVVVFGLLAACAIGFSIMYFGGFISGNAPPKDTPRVEPTTSLPDVSTTSTSTSLAPSSAPSPSIAPTDTTASPDTKPDRTKAAGTARPKTERILGDPPPPPDLGTSERSKKKPATAKTSTPATKPPSSSVFTDPTL